MSEHDDDVDSVDAQSQALRAQLPELAPPSGFADRVMAGLPEVKHRQPSPLKAPAGRAPRPSWLRRAAPAAVAAGVALAISPGVSLVSALGHRRGEVVAATMTAVAMPHASAVVDVGATLRWEGDSATVDVGEVFINASDDIVVHAGDAAIVVDDDGAAFRLSVTSPPAPGSSMTAIAPSSLKGAAIGAAVGAAATFITLSVFEGTVTMKNASGSLMVPAGTEAVASSTSAPRPFDAARAAADEAGARRRLADLQASIRASEAASRGDLQAVVADNERLRAQLKRQDEELALLDVERREREGVAKPFPPDLPARFTQPELLAAFNTAIEGTGLKGGVTAVDCTEYPCIVWGEVEGDTRELMDKLKASPEFKAAYENDAASVRGWGHGEGQAELFAVTLMPKSKDGPDKDLDRRLRARTEEQFEANKPASWKEPGDEE